MTEFEKMVSIIIKHYQKNVPIQDERTFKFNYDKRTNEISFYHLMWNDQLNIFKKAVKSVNNEILKKVHGNFFYKIVSFRDNVDYRFAEDDIVAYINRIQLCEIEKSPKNSHLVTLGCDIKELYV